MLTDDQMNINTTDRQLLYDIRELLKNVLQYLKSQENKNEKNSVSTGVLCKYCNGTHDNRYQIAACAKKKKKEEGV